MEKQFFVNNKSIIYTDEGKGKTLVLLHGYLETKEVWGSFAKKLSETFRVITIDLPGHGKSNIVAKTHKMNLMAECINSLLHELKINLCTMVGHSMGGYVTLAFAELFPEKLSGFVLFHSSVYADNDEKKRNRKREIEFIQNGKLDLIVNTNLPNTFANDNLETFSIKIEELKIRAKNNNPDGVCALLLGMMDRPDRQILIKEFAKPMLFIFGGKDNYIPVDTAKNMAELNPLISLKWLDKSGHMGFIEEEDISIETICDFNEFILP